MWVKPPYTIYTGVYRSAIVPLPLGYFLSMGNERGETGREEEGLGKDPLNDARTSADSDRRLFTPRGM